MERHRRSDVSLALGLSPLAPGWDSSLFRRLRALPNGNVEYRDGAELWTFTPEKNEYKSPAGLALKLVRRDGGWNLIDQQWRIATFDDLGRLLSESDEFYKLGDPESGNVIQYLYSDRGRLAAIVDPLGRQTTLSYNVANGLLDTITDWRGRSVTYAYDAQQLLETARLPEAKAGPDVPNEFDLVGDKRPAIEYGYQSGASTYRDRIELSPNLKSIREPGLTFPRISFDYDLSNEQTQRDRVTSQKWGTGELAEFEYPSPTQVITHDVMEQKRTYQLTAATDYDKRVHVKTVTAHGVLVIDSATLPDAAPTTSPASAQDQVTTVDEGACGTCRRISVVNASSSPAQGERRSSGSCRLARRPSKR